MADTIDALGPITVQDITFGTEWFAFGIDREPFIEEHATEFLLD